MLDHSVEATEIQRNKENILFFFWKKQTASASVSQSKSAFVDQGIKSPEELHLHCWWATLRMGQQNFKDGLGHGIKKRWLSPSTPQSQV